MKWNNHRRNLSLFFSTDLEAIITSNQNGALANGNGKMGLFDKVGATNVEVALKADSLCKTYNGNYMAVNDVTFSVKTGEVIMSFISLLISFMNIF